MGQVRYEIVGDGYVALLDYCYHSPRYKRSITVKAGMYSDGATWARDVASDAWWVHDVACRYGRWDDGQKISNWQASSVLYDILRRDGFWFRAPFWRLATFLFGGGAARFRGEIRDWRLGRVACGGRIMLEGRRTGGPQRSRRDVRSRPPVSVRRAVT